MELIPVTFHKILQSKAYTVIILSGENKRFAIYTAAQVGDHIQSYLTDEQKPRPLTHDLLGMILQGLNVKILQIVIHDVQDTVYFARLFLEQQKGKEKTILEVDARPSDCITLALINNIPIFCKKDALEKAVAITD